MNVEPLTPEEFKINQAIHMKLVDDVLTDKKQLTLRDTQSNTLVSKENDGNFNSRNIPNCR